jgi:hypothetical protein
VDIRIPVGTIFTVYGVLLILYGLISSDVEARHLLFGVQVNIVAGIGMLVFGVSFLYLARRGGPTVRRSSASPEGRAMEAREKRTGVEH